MKKQIDKTVAWSELCDAVGGVQGEFRSNYRPGGNYLADFYALNIISCIRSLHAINAADQLPARLFELCESNTPETGETFD